VRHAARPKAKKTQNLISGEMSARDKEILAAHAALNVTEAQEDEIIPLWKTEVCKDIHEYTNTFVYTILGARSERLLDYSSLEN